MSGAFRGCCALWLAAVGCGNGGGRTASLAVTPGSNDLVVGETRQLAAEARDGAGQPVDVIIEWTSSSEAIATVSEAGLVSALTPGKAVITASAEGRTAMASATVLEGGIATPSGSRITALGGAVVIDVPPGAIPDASPVAVRRNAAPPLDARLVGGSAVDLISPLPFGATLELAYDRGRAPIGLPDGGLRLAMLDGDHWREVAGSADDPGAARANGAIVGPGTYAVRQMDAAEPCTAAEDRQFDFWLGTWNIRGANGGGGHSVITRDDAGCLIFERFTENDYVGVSVNFFNRATGQWHQTYVDSAGARLLYSGSLVDGKMVLTSPPARQMSRITWSQSGSRVRQLGEDSVDGGVTWTVAFDGTYTRGS